MDMDRKLREYLSWLLESGDAHMTLDDAIADFPMNQINVVFPNSAYSFWGSLEHIRRTQADILEFIKGPYKEKEWPRDYWPERGTLATEKDWNNTLREYKNDLAELKKTIMDPSTDLFAKILHGTGQTVIREVLLVTDHTAYQICELVTMRRVFGHWDISHP